MKAILIISICLISHFLCAFGHKSIISDVQNFMRQPDLYNIKEPFEFSHIHTSHPLPANELQYHGTTTLAFIWKDEVICAVDSRASIGDYVGSSEVKKIFPLSKNMIATMAGGAADCAYWIRRISREVKAFNFEFESKLSVKAVAKLFTNVLRDLRQIEISVGTMIAGVDSTGPALFYLDSAGNCVEGPCFCVGSGATLAYAVLDAEDLTSLSLEAALDTAAWAVRHATHRDGFSGGFINVFRINSTGCHHVYRRHAKRMPLPLPK